MRPNVIPQFRKTTETFASGSRTLEQKYFVSPEVLVEEQNKIFSNGWLLVGHQNQIPAGGDFFVQDVVGESIIIVRDKAGIIHGFFNVCRHRGTRLCQENAGHVAAGHLSAIQCPYHAWTYGLDGRLIGAPHMDEVTDFDKNDYPLHRVRLGIWEGFIFVNLGENPLPLEEWLSPLTGRFSHWNLPNLRTDKRIEYDVRANWKLIFENYSECYHCPGVHPALSRISPYDSAENDLIEGPFLGGFMKINRGKSLTMSGNACAIPVNFDPVKALDTTADDRVFYYSVFPNMLLSMHPDYVMVHQLWPRSPDRTLIYCDWLFHPAASERDDFQPNDAIEFWDMTNKQDWHVCELSQQGIRSRAYVPGPYSSRESIPAAWDRYYRQIMK